MGNFFIGGQSSFIAVPLSNALVESFHSVIAFLTALIIT